MKKKRKKKIPNMGETHAVIYVHRHSECVMSVMLHSISNVT